MKICFVVIEIGFFLSHRFALAKTISKKHKVVLLRTVGVVFSDEEKKVSDYIG